MHPSSLENMQRCVDSYVCGEFFESRTSIRVLDVGSADVNGTYADLFSDGKFHYVGADVAAGPGVDLILEDPYRLPVGDGSFDLVISGQAFEHVEYFWLLFEEMSRIVKDDGLVFLIAPSSGAIHRYPVDCYRFHPDAYEALARLTGQRLVDVWLDERGPWNDLVGVFSRGDYRRPTLQEMGDKRRRAFSSSYLEARRPVPTAVEATTEEAEATHGELSSLEVLRTIHMLVEPRLYLEVGVREGKSLALASCPAIGVDPDLGAGGLESDSCRLFEETSDFFFNERAEAVLAGGEIDLAFIDGMHLFEFALRDFMNLERRAQSSTVIVVDDIFPNHPIQALRRRQSRVWAGDVWKLYDCLTRHRPDLLLIPVDASPTGLLVITGLDPDNRVLWDQYNPLVSSYMELEEPDQSILGRWGAVAPDDPCLLAVLEKAKKIRESVPTVKGVRAPGGGNPLDLTARDALPTLSIVVVVYNMRREAPRTLKSLSPGYQLEIGADDYEVIVVENGSPEALDPESVEGLGPNFRYLRLEDASLSPAPAVSRGAAIARGEYLGVMVDGARIVTPGVLNLALQCLKGFTRPVIGTLGLHLGPDVQNYAEEYGYSREVEDRLLESIDWPEDGYRLFEISALALSSQQSWFGRMNESNLVFLPKVLFEELGGFEEAFCSPGGGLVNLDFWRRACSLPNVNLITLLGEASFHQYHGGAATGLTPEELREKGRGWRKEYFRIRGKDFKTPERQPQLFGSVNAKSLPSVANGCEIARGASGGRPGDEGLREMLRSATRSLAEAKDEGMHLHETLNSVLGSRSWRITSPLRRLMEIWRAGS